MITLKHFPEQNSFHTGSQEWLLDLKNGYWISRVAISKSHWMTLLWRRQLSQLEVVFDRLRKAKLKLSPVKCILFQTRVMNFVNVVSEHEISLDPGKIEVVKVQVQVVKVKF